MEPVAQSKIILNGNLLEKATQLKHLDRLLFGSSQFFVFIDPTKKKENDQIATYETIQDEIAKEAGIYNYNTNMSQGRIMIP